jgi:shikimate kinase
MMMVDRHVALVGLMGSGKTTVGRLIADRLGLRFQDNDAVLRERTGLSAAEVAAREGNAALHDAESEELLELLSATSPSVIAAAASTIEMPACRDALKRRSFVAWLYADVVVLADRARRGGHRPLNRDVVAQLHEQAERRDSLFRESADVTVDVAYHDPNAAARRILAAISSGR